MSRDGNGNYNLPKPPFVPDTVISSADMNSDLSDIAAALTQSFSKDGQTIASSNWNLGTNRITAMANPINAQDAATKAYVDTGDVWGLISDTAATVTANIDVTWTAGDYRAIQVLVLGLYPATAGASTNLLMQARRSGAFVTSGYESLLLSASASGSTVTSLSGLTSWVLTRDGTSVAEDSMTANLLVDPGGVSAEPSVTGNVKNSGYALGRLGHVVTCALSEGEIDGLRFLWEGGLNFVASGRIMVLGLKASASIVSSISLSQLAANDIPYDFGEGPPPDTSTTNTLSTRLARAITIPADFSGSVGGCSVNPTGAAAFDVAVNGVSIGTATINSLGVVSWVSVTPGVPVSVAAGSVVSMSAPAPGDATLETVTFTIAATRTL